jgi:hypothetical protein
MQTNPDDPRVKLMQKWSQNMPQYGMQGASLAAKTDRDDEDLDNGEEDYDSDAKSFTSRKSTRSTRSISSIFLGGKEKGSAHKDIHNALRGMRGVKIPVHNTASGKGNAKGGKGKGKKKGKGKGKNAKGGASGQQPTQTHQNNHKNANEGAVVVQKKNGDVIITGYKNITKDEIIERKEDIKEFTHQFLEAVKKKISALPATDPINSNFRDFVHNVELFMNFKTDYQQGLKYLEMLYDFIDESQKTQKLKEIVLRDLYKKSKQSPPVSTTEYTSLPKRAILYVTIPPTPTLSDFKAKIISDNGPEKYILNVYSSMLKVILTYKRLTSLTAKDQESLKKKGSDIPSYKTSREEDKTYDWYHDAYEAVTAFKTTWETYHKHLTKSDKSKDTHKIKFFDLKPLVHPPAIQPATQPSQKTTKRVITPYDPNEIYPDPSFGDGL